MNEYYVFNKTVRGYLHILKERPCEDSSASYFSGEKKYSIAVVADGHGSSSCFRSDKGSGTAVETALNAIKIFCDYYLVKDENGGYTESDELISLLRNDKTQKQVIRRLTDSIISEWNRKVLEDLENNPVSKENIECSEPKYIDLYGRGLRLNHIYGTTLIAAVMLKNYLILFQQGDGRCDILYDDGNVEQPVPWDERCHGVYTTSMSDDDVGTSIRSAVINLNDKKIAACYIGCDGIEDSYRTMDGTHIFYMELSNKLTDDPDNFPAYLEEYLSDFSKAGSGDDISVSGIINTASVKNLYDIYKYRTEIYYLNENKIQINAKLNSMSRKYQHLKSIAEKSENNIISASENLAKEIISAAVLSGNTNKLSKKEKEIKDRYMSDLNTFAESIKKEFPAAYDIFEKALNNSCCETGKDRKSKKIIDPESADFQNKLKIIADKLKDRCKDYISSNKEFEEYDNKYAALNDKLKQCDSSIEKLNAEKQ